LLNYTRNFWP